jgi:hypothetical protein
MFSKCQTYSNLIQRFLFWDLMCIFSLKFNSFHEESRMNNILDEFKSSVVKFIRWNPDSYKINGKKVNKSCGERLELLRLLIDKIIDMINKNNIDDIQVYYMFYSTNNEKVVKHMISKNINKKDDI